MAVYAGQLEQIWQLAAAYALYQQIADATSSHRAAAILQDRQARVQAVLTGAYFIEAGVKARLEELIDLATDASTRFSGRFLINDVALDSLPVALTPEAIAARYELIRANADCGELPSAQYDVTYRISTACTEAIRLIAVRDGDSGLQFGLQVVRSGSTTRLASLALFDADVITPVGSAAAEHNKRVAQAWQAIAGSVRTEMWLNRVCRALSKAMLQECNLVTNHRVCPRTRNVADVDPPDSPS